MESENKMMARLYQVSELRSRHTEDEHKHGAYSWYQWTTVALLRKKQAAIDLVRAHPTRAVANLQYDSHKIADNGKPPIIDPTI